MGAPAEAKMIHSTGVARWRPIRVLTIGCVAAILAAQAAHSPASAQDTERLERKIDELITRVERIEDALDRIERRLVTGPPVTEAAFDLADPESIIADQRCDNRRLDKAFLVICYQSEWKIPVWVGYRLNQENLAGTVERTDDFREDPELAQDERSTLADYRGSGFDRGHMAPAAAFKRSREAMSTTFLLSNMAPQTPQLNRAAWRLLEDQVRDLARAGGEVWVFTGNLFLDESGNPISPAQMIGPNSVAVPTHCFKAILHRDQEGTWSAYGFIMPNQNSRLSRNMTMYLFSVDHVEEKTGIDFFLKLPDELENRIEATANAWPLAQHQTGQRQ